MQTRYAVVAALAFVGFWLLRTGTGSDWSGFIGVDRLLLPLLGAPWRLGRVFQGRTPQPQSN